MVPSGGDGGGGRTTMQQMLRERRPSFSSACAIFSVGPSRMYRFSFFFFFFLRHGLLSILVAPEIISGDYWGAARDEWRLGDEMYLSMFEGRMMSSSGCRIFFIDGW